MKGLSLSIVGLSFPLSAYLSGQILMKITNNFPLIKCADAMGIVDNQTISNIAFLPSDPAICSALSPSMTHYDTSSCI